MKDDTCRIKTIKANLIKYFVLVLAIFATNWLSAQLVADFKADEGFNKPDGSGIVVCNPDEIDFSSTSSFNGTPISKGDPDYKYEWIFQPYPTPSANESPSVAYTTTGVYNVTLTITKVSTGEKVSITKSGYVSVVDKPQVNFKVEDSVGCVPLPVKLTNQTVLSGPISATYNWVISGASGSSQENPTITINSPGDYNVFLEVTDEYGCTNSKTKPKVVKALKQPVATFKSDINFACDPPLNYTLTADETGPFRFNWNVQGIGDFTGNPISGTITSTGDYDITLTVDSGFGCFAQLTKSNYVRLSDLTVDFNLPNDTICPGKDYDFTQAASASATSYNWDFGDGSTSTLKNPEKRYTTPGTYSVCLSVRDSDGCVRDTCKTIEVDRVQPKMNIDPLVSCKIPVDIAYDATGSVFPPGSELRWRIDGNDRIGFSGTETFTSYGDYNFRLTITSPNGCKASTSVKEVKIAPIPVDIDIDKVKGCAPYTSTFTDVTNYGGSTVVRRDWRIEDKDNPGTAIYTHSDNANTSDSYTFTEDGAYRIFLSVENDQGCTEQDYFDVVVGKKPVADFEVYPKDTCAEAITRFVDSSYVMKDGEKRKDLIDSWEWQHKEGQDFQQNPEKKYFRTGHDTLNGVPQGTSPGTHTYYDLRLIAGYHGCFDTLYRAEAFAKWGPVSQGLYYRQNCGDTLLCVYGNMFAWTKRTWFFDDIDNELDTTIIEDFPSYQNVSFNGTFVGPTIHSQVLPTTDSVCIKAPNGFSGTVFLSLENNAYPSSANCILGRSLGISNKTNTKIESPEDTCLQVGNKRVEIPLKAVFVTGSFRWLYSLNGGPEQTIANNVFEVTFIPPSAGQYRIILEYDRNTPCTKRVDEIINVLSPEVNIVLEDGNFTGCSDLLVNLKGEPINGSVIDSWEWNVLNVTDPNDTILLATYNGANPPAHTFSGTGTYLFQLLAEDDIGCRTTEDFGETITLLDPIADYALPKVGYCDGDSLKIQNKSSFPAPLNYQWFFNDSLVSTDSIPKIKLFAVDTIDLKLRVDDGAGCKDSLISKKLISVDPYPVFDIEADKVFDNCPPLTTNLYARITSDTISRYIFDWDIGGSPSASDTTIASFDDPGSYDISLTVSTPNGCSASQVKDDFITLEGPSADEVVVSDPYVCANDSITFTVNGYQNTTEFVWNFGDGFRATTLPPDNDVRYAYPRGYSDPVTVTLFLVNGDCQVTKTIEVLVDELTALIEPLDEEPICGLPQSFSFVDISEGVQFSSAWNFDNEGYQPSNQRNYNSPGEYEVVLKVSDPNTGCEDTDTLRLEINDFPTVIASNDTIICAGDSALISATGAHLYSWDNVDGLGSLSLSGIDSTALYALPQFTTTFSVVGLDTLTGCASDDKVVVSRDSTFMDFALSYPDSCGAELVSIQYPSNPSIVGGNAEWSIEGLESGDLQIFSNNLIPSHNLNFPDTFLFSLSVWDKSDLCIQSKTDTVVIYPKPSISLIPDSVLCGGDSLILFGNGGDVIAWTSTNGQDVPVGYNPKVGPTLDVTYGMTVTDTITFCQSFTSVNVTVDHAKTAARMDTFEYCKFGEVLFVDTGSVGRFFSMDWGDGTVETSANPDFSSRTYPDPGIYTQTFIARDNVDGKEHCQDTLKWTIQVHPLPNVAAEPAELLICNYDTIQFQASGAATYAWNKEATLSDSAIANPKAYPDYDTWYYVEGTDIYNCKNKDSIFLEVVPDYIINPIQEDDTIFIGEFILMSFDVEHADNFGPYDVNITWDNDYELECTDCKENYSRLLKTSSYTIYTVDPDGCYPKNFSFTIVVEEKYVMDVPSGFSPNSDNLNDTIFVNGIGIKELLDFTVYNRWGEVVHQSDDISLGWDGTYKGETQFDETYVFQATVLYWNGTTETKRGYITLLR